MIESHHSEEKNISDGELTDSEVNKDYWFNVNEADESMIKKISSINRKEASTIQSSLDTPKLFVRAKTDEAFMSKSTRRQLTETIPTKEIFESDVETEGNWINDKQILV